MVRKTKGIASVLIVLRLVLKCFGEILKEASYNNGGRNIRNMISGLISISDIVGIKPIATPTIISKMG